MLGHISRSRYLDDLVNQNYIKQLLSEIKRIILYDTILPGNVRKQYAS